MSSSDAPHREWGNIYLGLNTLSLEEAEGDKARGWTEADEAAYLERVRKKAQDKAAAILAEAGREAERLRREAREQGYAAGMAEAEQEINEFRSAMSDSVSAVLRALQAQSAAVSEKWREELVLLVRLAVEKGTALVLSEERGALLEALFTQAVSALESRRSLVVHVNPEDEPAIADIIALAAGRYPDLTAWSVRANAGINPGGIKVESDDSLVDNRLEQRAALIDDILGRLTLPA